MTWLLAVLALPCLYWTQGPDTAAAVKAAGVERLCVASAAAESWRAEGVAVTPVTAEDLAAREALPAPGLLVEPGLASPTRSPWVTANGWRFIRNPAGKFAYDVRAGNAGLAASEALAYGADALLKIDPAGLSAAGYVFAAFDQLPQIELTPVADFAVVDDGSPEAGELMNLLVRRNLLFERLTGEGSRARHRLVVRLGTATYPREETADPSELALKIRRQLTDERRSLRIYGSEVVIGRLTADARRARLHLLNYGGRTIEGLRIRLRGEYRVVQAWADGSGRVDPTERIVVAGATEFSLPTLDTYAVIDLERAALK